MLGLSNPIFKRWENQLNGRYYMVFINYDLWGDWVLTKIWGRKGIATGRMVHTACNTYEEAMQMFKLIEKRRAYRGYVPL